MLRDVAVSGDRNVVMKGNEKILEYKYLIIQRMRNVKAKVTTLITGMTGTISKLLRQFLRNIPGKHKIKEINKTAAFGTANIPRIVLM